MGKKRKSYKNVDLTGKKFGGLTVVERVKTGSAKWVCKCLCGNTVIKNASRLFGGNTSCGCGTYRNEKIRKNPPRLTHGDSHNKLYHKYRDMLSRCYDKNNHNYQRYGGRGITVCEEWKNSYVSFREWAYANGYDQSLDDAVQQSIDRIDNDGNYCPENCKWSTAEEQANNRGITKLYPYNGKMVNTSAFCDEHGIYEKTFAYRRLKRNLTLDQILCEWNKIHNPSYIGFPEYAKEVGVTETTLLRWVKQGKLKAERVGRKLFVIRKE